MRITKPWRNCSSLLLGCLSAWLGACGSKANSQVPEHGCDAPTTVAKYGIGPLQKHPIYEEFILPGEIVAHPTRTLPLNSLVEGIVEDVYVQLGQNVQLGTPLLALRSPQLAGWQARREALRSLLQAARLRVRSLDSLLRDGLIARTEMAQAQADLSGLVAESLEVASNLRYYHFEGGRFVIRAPQAGAIIQLPIRRGMPVQQGDTLIVLSDLGIVRAQIYFYADQAGLLKEGLPVKLKFTGLHQAPVETQLMGLYPTLDPVERTGTAYVDLPNSEQRLYPGLYLQAVVTKPETDSATFIPAKAVVFSSNTHYALVWKGVCEWEVRPLQVRKALREGFFCSNLLPNDSVATQQVLLLFQKLTQRL